MSATLDRPILVIDDEPAIRTFIAEVLIFEGYPVLTAADGREALRVIEQTAPAMLVLDLWMPRLNGPALARTLAERGIDVPIVVMTASNAADPSVRAIGAQHYLQKPFELSELLSAIEELCPREAATRHTNPSSAPVVSHSATACAR